MNEFLSIILPHSDDELFVLPFIEQKLSEEFIVHIFFVTTDFNPKRKIESEKALASYTNVILHHVGVEYSIPDGALSTKTTRVFEELLKIEAIRNSAFFVTPTFEGGHKDHDEVFKIGRKLSVELQKPQFVFSLYNAYKTPFFRVATLFQGPIEGEISKIKFNLFSGLRYLRQCWYYKSQVVILSLLFPGLVRTFIFKREIEILKVTSFDINRKHPGRLFYESGLKNKVKKLLGMS